ncbi:hypothetical protein QUF63_03335 [Anaerolineales bacterium HSG25]|nr:hypothetical protein [Anaerolineales bacterium HSG25]
MELEQLKTILEIIALAMAIIGGSYGFWKWSEPHITKEENGNSLGCLAGISYLFIGGTCAVIFSVIGDDSVLIMLFGFPVSLGIMVGILQTGRGIRIQSMTGIGIAVIVVIAMFVGALIGALISGPDNGAFTIDEKRAVAVGLGVGVGVGLGIITGIFSGITTDALFGVIAGIVTGIVMTVTIMFGNLIGVNELMNWV